MAITLYLSNTNSDLSSGGQFNKALSQSTEASNSISFNLAANTTVTGYAFSPSDLGFDWATGSITVEMNFLDGDGKVNASVSASRVNSSGVVQETTPITAEQITPNAGLLTFTIGSYTWGTPSPGDRIRINYNIINTFKNAATISIGTGTTDTEVIVPFSQLMTYTAQINLTGTSDVSVQKTELNPATIETGYAIHKKINTGAYEIIQETTNKTYDDYLISEGNTYYYKVEFIRGGLYTGDFSNEVMYMAESGTKLISINLEGLGVIDINSYIIRKILASLTGEETNNFAAIIIKNAVAQLSGLDNTTATLIIIKDAIASLDGTTDMTTVITVIKDLIASLDGSENTTAATYAIRYMLSELTGIADVTTIAELLIQTVIVNASSNLEGAATVNILATLISLISASTTGTSDITIVSEIIKLLSSNLNGSSDVNTVVTLIKILAAVLNGTADITANTSMIQNMVAQLGGTSTVEGTMITAIFPVVTLLEADRLTLSDETGFTHAYLTITFDVNITEFVVRVLGVSYDTGTLAHNEVGNVPAGTQVIAEVDFTELYQEGANRVNVYGKSETGDWTKYEG